MRRLLLAVLILCTAPAAASAGTLTVTYPTATSVKVTGTADIEGATVYTQALTGGAPGFAIYASAGTTLAADLVATGCKANGAYALTASLVCPRTGLTLFTADLGDSGDTFDAYDTGTPQVVINGGPGGDYLLGGGGADTINGDAGNDALIGRGGDDTINGGADNDTLSGEAGANKLSGGPGADTISGGNDNDIIHGDEDNDTLYGYGGPDTIFGDDGADAIRSHDGVDTLSGGPGNDYFEGGAGTDTYDGGADVDTISYADLVGPATITMGAGANDGPAGSTGENVNTENVNGTFGPDTITGDGGPNAINGLGGTDTINGGPGDDTLKTAGEAAVMDGGPGADTFDGGTYASARATYAGRTAPVTVTFDGVANDGDPTANGGTGEKDNLLPNSMRGVIGSSGGDTLTGGPNPEYLDGGPGSDTIDGGTSDDTLVGGPGATTADRLTGGGGYDVANYAARTENLRVDLTDTAPDGAGNGAEGDVLAAIRGIQGGSGNDLLKLAPPPNLADFAGIGETKALNGGPGNDELHGTEAFDIIDGAQGDDTIWAYGAPDRVAGGPGADVLRAGDGGDFVWGDADKGAVYDYSDNGTTDVGDGPDTLDGGEGADTMIGGGGNDTYDGGPSNDVLWPGAGADVLGGGDGVDAVRYQSRGASVDVTAGAGSGDDGNAIDGPVGARDTVGGDVENLYGSNFADRLVGTGAANALVGNGGDDELRGLGGDDALDGGQGGGLGQGADILDGGPGVDRVTYQGYGAGVDITLDGVANDGAAGTGESASGARDNIIAAESFITGSGPDTITGSDADERFETWDGKDTINAGGGNDIIGSGRGADVIDAGGGDDLIATAYHAPETFTIDDIDGGRDIVDAGPGRDSVIASNDSDGNDLNGGTGDDLITYQGDYRPATINQDGLPNDGIVARGAKDNVSAFETLIGSTANDTITGGGGAVVLDGFSGNDTITGGAADESIFGGPGNDTIDGGGGDDLLDGGDGIFWSGRTDRDVLTGGPGTDTATYAERATTISVALDGLANDGDPTVVGGGEKDAIEAERVIGGEGGDLLKAGAAAATLRGGAGDDTITGGAAGDVLDGGPGKDTLASGAGADRLEALDGEVDTLTCDTRAGKTVFVDAAIDTFATCADPVAQQVLSGSGGGLPTLLNDGVTAPLPPQALGSPRAVPAPAAPRAASALLAAIKLSKSAKLKLSSAGIAIGSAACSATTRCTVDVVLKVGKKTVGRGTVGGTGTVKAQAWLTAAGRRSLKAKRTLAVTTQLTLIEGGSRAGKSTATTLKLTGSR